MSRPSFDNQPGTKKRRMLHIVVSRLPALFERLMLLDYQIGLNFASGVESWNVGELDIESAIARFSVLLCTTRIVTAYEPTYGLCRIRRAYIHIRHIGRAWQPSPTRRFCIQHTSESLPISESREPFCAGGRGGPPLRGGFGACGKVLYSSPILCRGGLPRTPVVAIVDWSHRMYSSLTAQAQKNDACFASSSRVYQHCFSG